MKSSRGPIVAVALALGVSAPLALAQGQGNRELHRFAIVPDPTPGSGLQIVTAIWTVDVEPTSVPLDFSTLVELAIDGTPVQTITVPVMIDPGSGLACQAAPPCGGACGTGTVNGEPVTLICYEDCDATGCECDCGIWIDTRFDPTTITSGEEVTVTVALVPGTVPDNDSNDNGQGKPYDEPIGWARQPESMHLTEVSAGVYDVEVPIQMEWEGLAGRLNLDTTAELRVNGVPTATVNIPALAEQTIDEACFVSGCGDPCGSFNGVGSVCDPLLWFDCGCGGATLALFPSVPVDPGDEIMVILRPAPGALPELPGFDDDDRITQVCCGTVAVDEPGPAARFELAQNRPNPFNPRTTITFTLTRPGSALVQVFDIGGRVVRTMLDRDLGAGTWSVTWDGTTASGELASPGRYFYRLTTPDGSTTRAMTLLGR